MSSPLEIILLNAPLDFVEPGRGSRPLALPSVAVFQVF